MSVSAGRKFKHRGLAVVVFVATAFHGSSAFARSLQAALTQVFPAALHDDIRGIGSLFSRTVASSFPITTASASSVYELKFKGAWSSRDIPLGPIFLERADPIGVEGAPRWRFSLNYEYIRFDRIDGHDLSSLASPTPEQSPFALYLCAQGPPPNPLCQPLRAQLDLGIEAQIVSASVTWGVMERLDLNLFVPLVRTSARAQLAFTALPPVQLPPPPPSSALEVDEGIGDILLRAKYLLDRTAYVDLASGAVLRLPTGDTESFHGTGDTELGASLYLSKVFADRLEPHLNAGFEVDLENPDRSRVRYGIGVDASPWIAAAAATLVVGVLGRSDLAQPEQIDRPVFAQVKRTDTVDLSTGLKLALTSARRATAFVNSIVPLNDQGLRSAVIITAGVEYVF